MRGRRTGLFALYLVGLGFAVLSPLPPLPASPESQAFVSSVAAQPISSMGWLPDFFGNLILFAPLGILLAVHGFSIRPVLIIGLALSVTIESVQLMIRGRYASPLDLMANTLGTGLGVQLAGTWNDLIHPSRRNAMRLSLLSCGLSASLLFALAWLAQPIFEPGTYFGGWTAELGHLERYQGRVIEAHVGAVPIPATGPASDSRRLRSELAQRAPIFLRAMAGPPPTALAPLLTIHDESQHEILLVGVEGLDLVLRRRLRTSALGLKNPALRLRDAFREFNLDEPLTIEITTRGPFQDVSLSGEEPKRLSWTPGRTWALLVQFQGLPVDATRTLDGLWIAMLIFPASFWARRRALAWVGVGALFVAIAVLPEVGTLEPSPTHEWLAAMIGVVIGISCSRRLDGGTKRQEASSTFLQQS